MSNNTLTIDFKKIHNDINGNPRYVCHFLSLLTDKEKESTITNKYGIAVKRANKIGGKKYHNKQYGGGIVFQSHNIHDTEVQIKALLTPPIKKGDNLVIIARRWFDRKNGNTYFSSVGVLNGIEVVSIPYEYGFAEHYKDRTYRELQKLGYMPDVKQNNNGTCEPLYQYAERKGFTLYYSVSDVATKNNL